MGVVSSKSINLIARGVIAKVQIAGVVLIVMLVGISLYVNLRSVNKTACKLIEAEFNSIRGPLSRELALGDKTTANALFSELMMQFDQLGPSKYVRLVESDNVDFNRKFKNGCSPGLFAVSINFPVTFGEKHIAFVRGDIEQLSLNKTFFGLLTVIIAFVMIVKGFASSLERHIKNFLIDPIMLISSNSALPNNSHYPDEVRAIEENIKNLKSDISEKERMNFELRKNKALGDLATEVAHDIRSPLAALACVVKAASLPEEHKKLLNGAAERIREIANTLLETNRKLRLQDHSDEVKVDSVVTPQSVVDLIKSVLLEKRAQLGPDSDVRITMDTENDDSFVVNVEPVLFKRVISNLLNNGIEALEGKGVVSVHLSKREGFVDITISDNGKGIPSEILPSLSQRGFSYGKNTGTGIGLYQAKTAIHFWKGTLSISSEFGVGTRIKLALPLANLTI